ncbi:MAG: hypothetical protein ABIK15_01545 [Pseudomonadota bacterium]
MLNDCIGLKVWKNTRKRINKLTANNVFDCNISSQVPSIKVYQAVFISNHLIFLINIFYGSKGLNLVFDGIRFAILFGHENDQYGNGLVDTSKIWNIVIWFWAKTVT